jgi:hypothetical protein
MVRLIATKRQAPKNHDDSRRKKRWYRSRALLVVRRVQILDEHAATRLGFATHAGLIAVRELDTSGFEGTLNIVKSASVRGSPA